MSIKENSFILVELLARGIYSLKPLCQMTSCDFLVNQPKDEAKHGNPPPVPLPLLCKLTKK